MNKIVKIVSILLLTVMLISTLSQGVLAAESALKDFDQGDWQSDDIDGVKDIAYKVLRAIRNIAVIVAIIMISIVGVKYMVGSAEEKAVTKKTFIPLIVGAILVVSALQIATMLFSLKAA